MIYLEWIIGYEINPVACPFTWMILASFAARMTFSVSSS